MPQSASECQGDRVAAIDIRMIEARDAAFDCTLDEVGTLCGIRLSFTEPPHADRDAGQDWAPRGDFHAWARQQQGSRWGGSRIQRVARHKDGNGFCEIWLLGCRHDWKMKADFSHNRDSARTEGIHNR